MLKHQSPETVCGYVKNIGRDGEEGHVLTLGELRDTRVDMFTTVWIGNSQTRDLGGKMVTPRGYRVPGEERIKKRDNHGTGSDFCGNNGGTPSGRVSFGGGDPVPCVCVATEYGGALSPLRDGLPDIMPEGFRRRRWRRL